MISNVDDMLITYATIPCDRIVLRRFREDDAPDVLAYGSDPETLRHLIWGGAHTMEEATAAITGHYWTRPGIYAIALKASDRCMGCIDLRVEPDHEKAGFGYVLDRAHWGRGYMTEALSALIRLCFEELELNRVEAVHYVGNEASGRVMQKCGMRGEGTRKQAVKVKGVFRDEVHYGITRGDWLSADKAKQEHRFG